MPPPISSRSDAAHHTTLDTRDGCGKVGSSKPDPAIDARAEPYRAGAPELNYLELQFEQGKGKLRGTQQVGKSEDCVVYTTLRHEAGGANSGDEAIYVNSGDEAICAKVNVAARSPKQVASKQLEVDSETAPELPPKLMEAAQAMFDAQHALAGFTNDLVLRFATAAAIAKKPPSVGKKGGDARGLDAATVGLATGVNGSQFDRLVDALHDATSATPQGAAGGIDKFVERAMWNLTTDAVKKLSPTQRDRMKAYLGNGAFLKAALIDTEPPTSSSSAASARHAFQQALQGRSLSA